jgi:hypothetical protein
MATLLLQPAAAAGPGTRFQVRSGRRLLESLPFFEFRSVADRTFICKYVQRTKTMFAMSRMVAGQVYNAKRFVLSLFQVLSGGFRQSAVPVVRVPIADQ